MSRLAMTTNILIIYASSMGNTKRMAEAIAAGAREIEDVNVLLRTVEETGVDEVWRCDALILGSPVRHGNADSRLRHFIESNCERLALSGRLSNKIGAVFTVGGHFGRHGDGGELAQLALLRPFAAAGMTIMSASAEGRDSSLTGPCWGPHARLRMHDSGRETLQPDILAIARVHGRRVAKLAQAVAGKPLNSARPAIRWPSFLYRLSAVFR